MGEADLFTRRFGSFSKSDYEILSQSRSADIIERIDLYPEKRPDGCRIGGIIFSFPVPIGGKAIREQYLENSSILDESVVFARKRPRNLLHLVEKSDIFLIVRM